jgi:ribosomal-protein-alanine N-acetyltransferase
VSVEVRTERLLLRGWTDSDRPAFAAINQDPLVMEFIGPLMSSADSDAFVDRMINHWDERGFGLWCVDVEGECIGFTGLSVPRWKAHFTPCVEVGWRLASAHWGRGYATEAAQQSVEFGFGELGLDEIVSFTTVRNVRSRRVMEKLGMAHDPAADFDHPTAAEWLRPHVLYRLRRAYGVSGGR